MRRLLAPFSVRQKLLAVVLLTTLTALLVAIMVMVGFDLRNYRQSLISDMTTQADLLGRTTAPALTFDDPRVRRKTSSCFVTAADPRGGDLQRAGEDIRQLFEQG